MSDQSFFSISINANIWCPIMHVDRKKARRGGGEGKEGSAGSISTSASVLKSEKKGSKKNSKDDNSKYKFII